MLNTGAFINAWNNISRAGTSALVPQPTETAVIIPSHLHVYDNYDYKHRTYLYTEKYVFPDKIAIFNTNESIKNEDAKKFFLTSLKYKENSRNITEGSHLSHPDLFVDWSVNNKEQSLKDILKFRRPLFNNNRFKPIKKDLYLEYDFKHYDYIRFFGIYKSNEYYENAYKVINFGRRRSSVQSIKEVNSSYYWHYCKDSWELAWPHDDVRGFEGVCHKLDISGKSPIFPDKSKTVTYSTGWTSFKEYHENYYTKLDYYFTLGEFVDGFKNSENLLEEKSLPNFYVNYDYAFRAKIEDKKLKFVINVDDQKIKDVGYYREDTENFIKASYYLNFEFLYTIDGQQRSSKFFIEDIVKGNAFVNLPSSFISPANLKLKVTPRFTNSVVFVSNKDKSQTYEYNISTSWLRSNNNFYDTLKFEIPDIKQLYPSELLDRKKLSSYFQMYFESRKLPNNIDLDFLKSINISGEVDDLHGTVGFTYKYHGQQKTVSLQGFKKIPSLSNLEIIAKDIPDVKKQLKEKFPDITDYFLNNLEFQEKNPHDYDSQQVELTIVPKTFNEEFLKNKNPWHFSNYRIFILNPRNVALIQKTNPSSDFKQLSDLFELNPFAQSVKLTKDDYQYQIINETNNELEILVTLDSKPIKDKFRPKQKHYKSYKFNIKRAIPPALKPQTIQVKNEMDTGYLNKTAQTVSIPTLNTQLDTSKPKSPTQTVIEIPPKLPEEPQTSEAKSQDTLKVPSEILDTVAASPNVLPSPNIPQVLNKPEESKLFPNVAKVQKANPNASNLNTAPKGPATIEITPNYVEPPKEEVPTITLTPQQIPAPTPKTETNKTQENKNGGGNLWSSLITTENLLIGSSSIIFAGATSLGILRKFGYLKSKFI